MKCVRSIFCYFFKFLYYFIELTCFRQQIPGNNNNYFTHLIFPSFGVFHTCRLSHDRKCIFSVTVGYSVFHHELTSHFINFFCLLLYVHLWVCVNLIWSNQMVCFILFPTIVLPNRKKICKKITLFLCINLLSNYANMIFSALAPLVYMYFHRHLQHWVACMKKCTKWLNGGHY